MSEPVANLGEPAQKGRTVVTGGAGFIGAHLVRRLVAMGRDVVALDNLHRGSWTALADVLPSVTCQFGDVRDIVAVKQAFRGARTVFHLAAQSNVLGADSDPDYSFHTNVAGTFNVLRVARQQGVSHVIMASSREVYGEVAGLPVRESTLPRPKNAYGASKAAGEAYCHAFASPDCRVAILRLANVYGAGDRDRVIPRFVSALSDGRRLVVFGRNKVLDFVPVRVVVDAMISAESIAEPGPINVGSGNGRTLTELANRLALLMGTTPDIRYSPERTLEVSHYVADVSKMKSLLGIDPPDDPFVDLCQVLGPLRPMRIHDEAEASCAV